MKERLKALYESRWLKIGLSLAMVGVLVHYTDLHEVRAALRTAQPLYLVAAFLSILASHLVCVERWRQLARPLGFDQPWGLFFGSYFTGMFMNLFAPSTVAGDLGRTLFLAGGSGRKSLALTTVVAERGVGFIVLASIGAIAIVLQPQYDVPPLGRLAAWLVIPAFVLGWRFGPALVVRLFSRTGRLRRLIEVDLAPYWHDLPMLGRALTISIVFHILQIYGYVFVAQALGLNVPTGFFFLLAPVVNIVSMAPITFSGVGIREAGMLFFLRQVGVPEASAVAVGILASALTLANGVVGGIVYMLWQMRRKARA